MFRLFFLMSLMGCQGLFNIEAKTPEQDGPTIYTIPETSPQNGPKTNQAFEPKCAEVMALANPSALKNLTDLKNRFLESHNEIRRIYGLNDLAWSEELAKYAQDWANYLRDNKQCKMHHRSSLGLTEGKSYGENLAWNWISITQPQGTFIGSPEKANISWSKECKDYDYNSNSCKEGEQCGHFTQVIWKNSKLVGCGVAICDERNKTLSQGHSEVWVCNYDPAGNITLVYPDGRRVPQKPF